MDGLLYLKTSQSFELAFRRQAGIAVKLTANLLKISSVGKNEISA
jgi:hypothetical protein